MKNRTTSTVSALAVIALGTAATACGTGGDAGEADTGNAALASIGTIAPVEEPPVDALENLPLVDTTIEGPTLVELSIAAATSYTPLEAATVTTASHVLISECMAAAGHAYDFEPASASAASKEDQRRLAVMLFTADSVAATGYDALLPDPSTLDAADVTATVESSPEAQSVLADCQATSDAALNPDETRAGTNLVPGALQAEQDLNIEMLAALEREAQRWTECMTRNGIADARVGSIPRPVADGTISSVEAAVTDAECRTESGYTDRLISFRTAAVADYLAQNADAIANAETARSIEVANAEQVLLERRITVG